LVAGLRTLGPLPPNKMIFFFTCDASSMYTNINTHHALETISTWLATLPIPAFEKIDTPALLAALRIVMTHNVFRFGDTFWVQLSGTAIGTPPAPMYATLYFAIHVEKVIPEFAPELRFYGRYIDDGFGIWIPVDPLINDTRGTSFQTTFGSFGRLT
jgi:hypothetical protein